MKTSGRPALAGLLSLVLASSPVLACCDDFWSCAGAVVSGGLTCVIELALDGLKSLLDRATRERDAAAQGFNDAVAASIQETKSALDASRQAAHDAATDAAASAKRAATLAGDDKTRLQRLAALPAGAAGAAAGGAGSKLSSSTAGRAFETATPTPAGIARLGVSALQAAEYRKLLTDESAEDVRKRIQQESDKARGMEMASAEAASKAQEAAERSVEWSRASFAASVLAGMASLQVVIRDGISNPLGAVAALAEAVAAIALVEKVLADLQPQLDQEANKRADLADAARPAADQARAHAQKARDLLAKLEKMVRLETLLERQAVHNTPLLATTPAPSARARMLTPARLAGFTKSLRQRVGTLRTDAQKLTLVRAPDVAPFRAKVSADFAAQFKGKGAPAAAATRDSLLAEARRRFASDPKTLAGVEKLITDASKVR
ncbi:MAG TPA: hypothetical protein VGM13_08115 [Thermoanaerobaculia bacterium]|jgi:hypothetical protein